MYVILDGCKTNEISIEEALSFWMYVNLDRCKTFSYTKKEAELVLDVCKFR